MIAENPKLQVVRADMPDTWIHGWMSMPIESKAVHTIRPLEPTLDTLDTQLRLWGLTTTDLTHPLAEAYENSNLFSEHTWGPCGPNHGPWESDLSNRYLYGQQWKSARERGAYKNYEKAFDDKRAFAHNAERIVRRELKSRLDLLAKAVSAKGKRVVVYNGLPWPRSGIVDIAGNLLYVQDVPASGYKTITDDHNAGAAHAALSTANTLDTPFYRATFDRKRGGIASLVEKKTGRELVDSTSPYALGQFLHERFDHERMLAYHNAYGRPNYTWFKENLPKDITYAALTPPSWKLRFSSSEAADIATLTATQTLGLAKRITIAVIFPRHQPSVEIQWTVVDKTPDPLPEGGWLCFPFAVAKPRFQLGRLGAPIDPVNDIVRGANRHYFCLNSGLTIVDPDDAGVGLCPIDSQCVSLDQPGLWKFSFDYVPKKPTVFVNLYNNQWNTNFPEWIEGTWTSRVRFWPTPELTVPCWEARLPLLAAEADGPAGALPLKHAGVTVSQPGVLVTAFGPNPDGPGTLLRVWDQTGRTQELTVNLPGNFATATPVNLRGEVTGEPLTINDNRLVLPLHAYRSASFILHAAPGQRKGTQRGTQTGRESFLIQ